MSNTRRVRRHIRYIYIYQLCFILITHEIILINWVSLLKCFASLMWLLENSSYIVSHFYRHHCANHVSNNWNDNILVSKKCLCGFGVKGRVAHSNNQLPSYLLVEVSARLQLPEKKASKAATCSQVDGRLLTGIRGCVDGGPGLQQMLQTIHLREKNSSSTPSRLCPGSCPPEIEVLRHSKNPPTLKRLDLAAPSGQYTFTLSGPL